MEITYILEGYSQFDAHLKANSLANYQKACCEYYKTLKIRPEKVKEFYLKGITIFINFVLNNN